MQNASYRKIHLSQLLSLGKNNKQSPYSEVAIAIICPSAPRHPRPACQPEGACPSVCPRRGRQSLLAADVFARGFAICSSTRRPDPAASKACPADFCPLKREDLGQPGADFSLRERLWVLLAQLFQTKHLR